MSCPYSEEIPGSFFSDTNYVCVAKKDKKIDYNHFKQFCKGYDYKKCALYDNSKS